MTCAPREEPVNRRRERTLAGRTRLVEDVFGPAVIACAAIRLKGAHVIEPIAQPYAPPRVRVCKQTTSTTLKLHHLKLLIARTLAQRRPRPLFEKPLRVEQPSKKQRLVEAHGVLHEFRAEREQFV